MITGSSLSDADRQRIEGYLAHKWGLTGDLASGHPYKTAAPTNGAVQNNPIFGYDAGKNKCCDPDGNDGPVTSHFSYCNSNYGKKDGVEQVPFALQQPGPFSLKRRATAYQVTRGDEK